MDTITVNGVEFKVDNDRTNIAICEKEAGGVLIEASIDHDAEQIILYVHVDDDCETVNYFEFVHNTDALVEWMANRLFA